jgi:hypothetical protein
MSPHKGWTFPDEVEHRLGLQRPGRSALEPDLLTRTRHEVGDPRRVLDGDLDPFIKTYLMQKASGTLGAAAAPDEE